MKYLQQIPSKTSWIRPTIFGPQIKETNKSQRSLQTPPLQPLPHNPPLKQKYLPSIEEEGVVSEETEEMELAEVEVEGASLKTSTHKTILGGKGMNQTPPGTRVQLTGFIQTKPGNARPH